MLPAGEPLFAQGDAASHLFLLEHGRLAAFTPGSVEECRLLGLIAPGEVVGEMALLAGTPHRNRVVALRDSTVIAIPADSILESARTNPELLLSLTRLAFRRQRAEALADVARIAKVVSVAAVCPSLDPRPLAAALADALRLFGRTVELHDASVERDDDGWLARAEARCDFVILVAPADAGDWSAHCRRQADRVLLVGSGDAPPPVDCALGTSEALLLGKLVDLVLVREAGCAVRHSTVWRERIAPTRLFQIERGSTSDVARIARNLTGTSVGLVLSGGGARAFAHVGAIRALREAAVPIDLVAGTSMGAVIAAGVASGWDDAELDERMRDAFVRSSPLSDIALPIVAMTRGRLVEHRLERHFGNRAICDLSIPFSCVSANLTDGGARQHDGGPLVAALRASIALPGVLPPTISDGVLLVDGGVIENLPSRRMRRTHDGPLIAVDVTHARGLSPADARPPASWWRWWGSGAWRRGPPIVSILMHSATIASGASLTEARDAADLYVMPPVGHIEIRNWTAYDDAVERGYRAMRDALATLGSPVADLHRRRREIL